MHDDISLSPQRVGGGNNNVHSGSNNNNNAAPHPNINVGANSGQAGSSSPRDFMHRQGRSGDSQQEVGVNLDLPSQSSTSRFRATSSTHTMAKIQPYGVAQIDLGANAPTESVKSKNGSENLINSKFQKGVNGSSVQSAASSDHLP